RKEFTGAALISIRMVDERRLILCQEEEQAADTEEVRAAVLEAQEVRAVALEEAQEVRAAALEGDRADRRPRVEAGVDGEAIRRGEAAAVFHFAVLSR
ncbi:MAG: hypothetical protein LUI07_02090, partial [Lachnospiraceae bacterium]|nr:hypothetical protein [Lachnospiraceae bacterium]